MKNRIKKPKKAAEKHIEKEVKKYEKVVDDAKLLSQKLAQAIDDEMKSESEEDYCKNLLQETHASPARQPKYNELLMETRAPEADEV